MTISSPPEPDLDSLPALPRNEDGPVFGAPWQAQAFAMTLELHRRGVFTWREWAGALADEIASMKSRGACDDGSHYYDRWLAALEALIARKRVVAPSELSQRVTQWEHAAAETPHGQPVVLLRGPGA